MNADPADEEFPEVSVEVEMLCRLLVKMHPASDSLAHHVLLGQLLDHDLEQGRAVIESMYRWNDGDSIVHNIATSYGLDPTSFSDSGRCAGGCDQNVTRIGEFGYMVSPEVWQSAGDPEGYWCIGCLEERLGRQLQASDFADVPLTTSDQYFRSERLQARISPASLNE